MTKDPNAPVTNKILDEAVNTILKGMDNLLQEERKFNLKIFATKEDLKPLATKEDLSREAGWLRDGINGLKADLSDTVSKNEFNKFKTKVNKNLSLTD